MQKQPQSSHCHSLLHQCLSRHQLRSSMLMLYPLLRISVFLSQTELFPPATSLRANPTVSAEISVQALLSVLFTAAYTVLTAILRYCTVRISQTLLPTILRPSSTTSLHSTLSRQAATPTRSPQRTLRVRLLLQIHSSLSAAEVLLLLPADRLSLSQTVWLLQAILLRASLIQ